MSNVLVLGDERDRVQGVRSLLREDGHTVQWVRDVATWRDAERRLLPEVVVAAVSSPEPVIVAKGRPPRGFPAPLLFVHGEADFPHDARFDERLVDRIESPFGAEELLGRVDALARVRRVVLRSRAALAASDEGREPRRRWWTSAARGLVAVMGSRVPRYAKPPAPYLEVAARVAEWADRRDGFEPGHADRVTAIAGLIADELGLPDGEAAALLRAAMLHDIGKVALPVEILRQQGPLDGDQLRLVRTHPEKGAALMTALDDDEEVARTILLHHERPDGRGYYGKTADQVPRSACVLAVAEAYDAMITSRVRQTLSADHALALMKERRGEQFDAACVDALADAIRPRPNTIPLSSAPRV